SLFIIGHMGLFVYTQKGSIISMVVLPTTEIIEPKKAGAIASACFFLLPLLSMAKSCFSGLLFVIIIVSFSQIARLSCL
ncbi:hypothetical protein, partial [Streptococcus dysgalactiae]|uniref:hypothetical protein n=1 Tax=Streptococcus dysgalactiae TaxID=1334 RepID=UPI003983BBC7